MPLEGENQGQLIEFADSSDGLSNPHSIAVHPTTHRLYAGNNASGEILEFEVNVDGTKGQSRVFGTFFTNAFHSMAIRPSTGRVYFGSIAGVSPNPRGIFRASADGSGCVSPNNTTEVTEKRPPEADPASDGKTGIVTVTHTLAVRYFYRRMQLQISNESNNCG